MTIGNITSNPWVKNGRLYNQSFHHIKAGLDEGCLFKDLKFPPSKSSISYSGVLYNDIAKGGKMVDINKITWIRAKDLYKNAQLVVNGTDRNDVNQGSVGNCWFLAAMVQMCEIPQLFDHVVPKDQGFGKDLYCTVVSSTSDSGNTDSGLKLWWTTTSQ